MKKQEVVLTGSVTSEVAVLENVSQNEWGNVVLEQKDLVLPKILLQQSMSEAVKQKKMVDGEFLNTLTDENMGTSMELIPFYKRESVVIEKYNGKKFEFYSIIPYDGKNRPFEETIEGVRFKNSHLYEFFVLTKELGLPHIISLKGTSNKVGRQLATLMYASNPSELPVPLPPPGKWITYSSKPETSRDGDMYHVSSFTPSRLSTKAEIDVCKKWIGVILNSSFSTAEEAKEKPLETTRF